MADKKKQNDIPKSSLTSAITTDLPADPAPTKHVIPDQSPMVEAGLGLVKVDGIDFRYVGIAPAQDKDPETPSGFKITADNSTFQSLETVPFHPSIRIKDPKTGEFYYPGDGVTNWEGCELNGNRLVPEKKKSAKS